MFYLLKSDSEAFEQFLNGENLPYIIKDHSDYEFPSFYPPHYGFDGFDMEVATERTLELLNQLNDSLWENNEIHESKYLNDEDLIWEKYCSKKS